MSSTTLARPSSSPSSGRVRPSRNTALYGLLCAAVGAAWLISRQGWFQSGDDISYWMAVCGGSMMLLLFVYPLRKHVRSLHGLGRVKWWLWLHMVLGLLGPWLILVHSTFRIGSVNAGVAMLSMVVVVASGVVGRFLYGRVHRGLDGQRVTLQQLQQRLGLTEGQASQRLRAVPELEQQLRAFQLRAIVDGGGWRDHARALLWLPLQRRRLEAASARQIAQALQARAAREGWTAQEGLRRQRAAMRAVRQYLRAVVGVAQYAACVRLFALWHVAHLPFVILLVFSAIVHVVAVHAY